MCIRDRVCPDEIRHQWKERLIIDLDSSYPLDLTFGQTGLAANLSSVSYTHLRAHETVLDLVCRLLLEKKKQLKSNTVL